MSRLRYTSTNVNLRQVYSLYVYSHRASKNVSKISQKYIKNMSKICQNASICQNIAKYDKSSKIC